MAYYSSTGTKRHQTISPYIPDRVELIGNNTKQASSTDIGKAVKISGNAVVVCAEGDEIYGFITNVEAGSKDGYSIGGVACDVGREMWANDASGGLAVGNLVVAGVAVALGTAHHANGANVKAAPGSTVTGQSQIFNTGGLAIKAGGSALAKTVNTIQAMVGGTLVSEPAGDMEALAGTVVNATYNVFAFFLDAAGAVTTVMGTAGATLADVVIPQASATRAMIGYVIIHPTGTGNFVGGTTPLDDTTVAPNAVYVNTVGPVAQAEQILGVHQWMVIGLEVDPSTANKQVLLRKV